ncbi:MAG: chromate resistance protein ChrB domain-containing protein [Cyclobacteriaceae bacterium]
MANIVRGADTDRHDVASQSSGLWVISAGLSQNIQDDQALLNQGIVIYEALYTWAKELKEIIQDQIDTNLALSLKDVSQSLKVHPSYLSLQGVF